MALMLRRGIQTTADHYPLVGYTFFGSDSATLVFEDSSMTTAALSARTWMFGPSVTKAEADGCPPEKVLGRKIARVLFRELGRPTSLKQVSVVVRGAVGLARWSYEHMYYYPDQLSGRWAGDSILCRSD
ncbi:MAG TPA: hypothetical protein VIJ16_04020 [Gemmatimonadaceae bacterium]